MTDHKHGGGADGLQPAHRPEAFFQKPVVTFGAIGAVASSSMQHTRLRCGQRRRVRPGCVGDDPPWRRLAARADATSRRACGHERYGWRHCRLPFPVRGHLSRCVGVPPLLPQPPRSRGIARRTTKWRSRSTSIGTGSGVPSTGTELCWTSSCRVDVTRTPQIACCIVCLTRRMVWRRE
jgi:hypothetical protein